MDPGEEEDSLEDIERGRRSNDGLMMVILAMVAIGGIVVTLVSALIGTLS